MVTIVVSYARLPHFAVPYSIFCTYSCASRILKKIEQRALLPCLIGRSTGFIPNDNDDTVGTAKGQLRLVVGLQSCEFPEGLAEPVALLNHLWTQPIITTVLTGL